MSLSGFNFFGITFCLRRNFAIFVLGFSPGNDPWNGFRCRQFLNEWTVHRIRSNTSFIHYHLNSNTKNMNYKMDLFQLYLFQCLLRLPILPNSNHLLFTDRCLNTTVGYFLWRHSYMIGCRAGLRIARWIFELIQSNRCFRTWKFGSDKLQIRWGGCAEWFISRGWWLVALRYYPAALQLIGVLSAAISHHLLFFSVLTFLSIDF